MRHTKRWILASVVVLPVVLAACGGAADEGSDYSPVQVEKVKGSAVHRITLTREAAGRIDLRTAAIGRAGPSETVPYSALLYTADGTAWVFVRERPLTFTRHRVVVADIRGNRALVSAGPVAGTPIVVTGV